MSLDREELRRAISRMKGFARTKLAGMKTMDARQALSLLDQADEILNEDESGSQALLCSASNILLNLGAKKADMPWMPEDVPAEAIDPPDEFAKETQD
jgi:hypothetical protein